MSYLKQAMVYDTEWIRVYLWVGYGRGGFLVGGRIQVWVSFSG